MAQHFLLSAAARTLSLRTIYKDGEEAAYAKFCEMRWTDGEPVCPDCGCCDPYSITTRRVDNGGLAYGLVANAMGCPVSRAWKGYWQRAA